MPHTVHHSTSADDLSPLVGLLCAAFDDDPVVNHFIRQDSLREQAFREFFTLALARMTLPYNSVFHTEDHRSCALWAPPGCWHLGLMESMSLLPSIWRIAGPQKRLQGLRGLRAMDAAHPPEPHFYLSFLATHPDHQGQGFGGVLLRHTLEHCDHSGLPAYLENTKPENEGFYRKHGFKKMSDRIVLPGGPDYYLPMWREPAPPG